MFMFLMIPFLGFVNRVRGGLFGTELSVIPWWGTQAARAFFAIIMALSCAVAYDNFWMVLSAPLWFLCEFLPNGDYLGMTSVWQFVEATCVGIGNVLGPVVLIYFAMHSWWAMAALLLAGALKGCCYYAAKYVPSVGNNIGFNTGAEMAEFLFGCVLGTGIVLGGL